MTNKFDLLQRIYNDLIEVRNVLTAVERAETLADSLKERFVKIFFLTFHIHFPIFS